MKLNPSSLPAGAQGKLRRPKERGVALVTVLAIVLLMTVLIMSFFTMAQAELTATQKDSDNLKARALADAALNMAISQIREATTQVDTGDTRPYPWSSQPGAIRVFQKNGTLKGIYKLYSARQAQATGGSGALNEIRAQDIEPSWDEKPDEWVDLNEPVVVPNLAAPDDLEQAEILFPIVDPRAKRAQLAESVEGFDYNKGVNGVVDAGGGSAKQRLPMPVRWLYILADGSIGYIQTGGDFIASGTSTSPSKENPIVGRVGFWTDDETCKINVNTASEGVHWETPRFASKEDESLAANQPVNGEYQRYPGHPAMVCLSSVLFPNERFLGNAATTLAGNPSAAGGVKTSSKRAMSKDHIRALWRMAPFISADPSVTSDGGFNQAQSIRQAATSSGNNRVATVPPTPNGKHLYASNDDLLFSSMADAKDGAKAEPVSPPRERQTVDVSSQTKIPVDRIQQSRFFLTTHSSAPEISLHGLPRVSMWPIANTLTNFNSAAVSASSRYSIYDTLIAFNTSFKKNGAISPYYFMREDFTSRHAEIYVYSNAMNIRLINYLNAVTTLPIPGFSLRKGPQSLAQKYGEGLRGDANSIVALMTDYIRMQNLYDPNLAEGSRYNAKGGSIYKWAYGQSTAICLCGGSSDHDRTWFVGNVPQPKGIGRFFTISEVAMMITLRAKQPANGTIKPAGIRFVAAPATIDTSRDSYEYEVGFLLEAFAPAQGWGEYRPWGGVTMIGGTRTGTGVAIPAASGFKGLAGWSVNTSMTFNNQPLQFTGTGGLNSIAVTDPARATLPAEWIAAGGYLGTRVFTTVITMRPNFFQFAPGQPPPPAAFGGTATGGSAQDSYHPRLVIYDDDTNASTAGTAISAGNLIQVIPLCFPSFRGLPLPTEPHTYPLGESNTIAGGSVQSRIKRARLSKSPQGVLFGPDGIIQPTDIVQSIVPSHGDFRLIAAKRVNMNGLSKNTGTDPSDYPSFMAVPGYGRERQAHSLMESVPEQNAILAATRSSPARTGFFDPSEVGRLDLDPAYFPDFPIKPWSGETINTFKGLKTGSVPIQGVTGGGQETTMPASEAFFVGRYDDYKNKEWEKGPGRPDWTGDFDTGVGPLPDGPFINKGDEGELRGVTSGVPYYSNIIANTSVSSVPPTNPANFSPNRLVQSPVAFGSLPSTVTSNVPWTTLLFRPDPAVYATTAAKVKERRHFGSKGIHDHLWLDLFWMPVVQPYSISEPFETKGKINMNYQILPFTYITRATALHALMKPERITLVPDNKASKYKLGNSSGAARTYPTNQSDQYRRYIDPGQTLRQFEQRFANQDQYSQENGIAPGAFLSPSEICDQFLVPEGDSLEYARTQMWTEENRLTGENLKERPYGNLYPRLTTRSNAFRVHVVAQSIKKAPRSDPAKFERDKGDNVTAEYRGSYLVERTIDPSDGDIPDYALALANSRNPENYLPLDLFYYYRISQVKQFVR